MAKNTVSFIDPTDANALQLLQDSQKAQRNQELALLLKKRQIEQGNTLGNTQMVSGIAIKNSPLAGLAQLLQTYNADKNLENADTALAQQQLAQAQAEYGLYKPTDEQPAIPAQTPIAQDTAVTAPIPSPDIQTQSMPVQQEQIQAPQQSFTPPPSGLKSPFSFDANVPPPNYGGQPINIANQNGQVSQLAGMLRPPVNDIRPLPIAESQPQQMPMSQGQSSPLAQLIANPNANVQIPQQPRAVNPFNALGLSQRDAWKYSRLNPEVFAKANLEALQLSADAKRARELGISTDEQARNYRLGANKDLNTASLNNGFAPQIDAQGRVIGVQPLAGFNENKAGQITAQNTANMPYDAYKTGLKVNEQQNIDANKQGLENRNSFVDTIDPATGNKKSITKEQALNQGGIVTGLGEANTQLQKDYATQYNTAIKTGAEARQKLPSLISRLDLINNTKTGLGTQQQNDIKAKLATYGVDLGGKKLTNQQLLEAELYVDTLGAADKLKPASDTDIKILKDTVGSLNTNPEALRKLTYKRLGALGQDIYNSSLADTNVKNNGGFSKYSDVYTAPNKYDRNNFVISSLKGNRNLLTQFFQSLSPQEKQAILNKGKK